MRINRIGRFLNRIMVDDIGGFAGYTGSARAGAASQLLGVARQAVRASPYSVKIGSLTVSGLSSVWSARGH